MFQENKRNTKLLLYDITSIFFEGEGPKGLAKNGYSRDKRPDTKQIILSLVLNENKLPVYFDIWEGNTSDKKTIIPFIQKLKKKFNLSQSIFIGDRGIVDIKNIEFLESEGIDYIVALTHTQARALIFSHNIQLHIFDKELPITLFTEGIDGKERKYVLCGSEYRNDEQLLSKLLEKGKNALKEVERMVESGRLRDPVKVIRRAQKKLTETGCERFYDFKYERGKFQIIEKSDFIRMAKALCGYYILQTNAVNLEDEEIEKHYKELKFVETSFKELKDGPIFHWKERRVKTHIFLCILAQTLVNKIKDKLKEKGRLQEEKGNSFDSFLDIMGEIQLGFFEVEGVMKEIVTQLTFEQKEFISFFDIDEKYFKVLEEMKKIYVD